MIKLKILLFVCALFFIAGCSNDEEKGDYSTVSNMIADRNKARYNKAAKDSAKKNFKNDEIEDSEEMLNNKTEDKKFTGMTFEEEVRIVSESSGKTISMGTAYLDKSGKIIKLRIKNR